MTSHVNKVHHVTIITEVAKDLGKDEDWLRDIANRNGDRGRPDVGLWRRRRWRSALHRLWHRKPNRAPQVLQENLKLLARSHGNDPTSLRPTPDA
ncbi:hypothetical protein [Bradyrhizobium sp. USDA 3315]